MEILKVDDNINGGDPAVDIVIVDTSHKFPRNILQKKTIPSSFDQFRPNSEKISQNVLEDEKDSEITLTHSDALVFFKIFNVFDKFNIFNMF